MVKRTKTISFREHVLTIPFFKIPGSILCVYRFVMMLLCFVKHPFQDSQFVSYVHNGTWTRATYSWFMRRLTKVCSDLGLVRLTTHSLRRGCATSLADSGFSLLEIRNLGDWTSLSVLRYISHSLESKMELDRTLCDSLFSL